MSDIGAPPAAAGPVAVAAGTTAIALGQVALSQVPDRLSLLTRPVLLSGTVTAQGSDGTTVLRTQAGPVAFTTTTPLAADTPVTLQINAGQPPTTANAFVVATPTAAGITATALPLPTATAAAGPAVTTTLGTLAQAALAGAEGRGDRVPPPSLPPGSVVPGQVLPPAQGRGTAAAVPPPGSAANAGAPAGPPVLVPGTTVAVRVLPAAAVHASPSGVPGTAVVDAAQTPDQPDRLPPPAAPGAAPAAAFARPAGPVPVPSLGLGLGLGRGVSLVVTGTITGTTAGGQPILTTSAGALALTTTAVLAPGRTLTVQLSDPSPLFVDRPAPVAAAVGPGAQTWTPLREALEIVTGQEGGLAQAVLTATLPQPNRRLAAALTFALDAVRRGDARGWFGAAPAAALEKAGRRDLLAQLDKEFRTLAREADDTPPGGWRPLAIPMLDGGVIRQIELFVRAVDGDDPGTGDGGGGRSQRFLVDLDLSRLGALQLDGLVRSKSKRFDLILRSLQPLPEPLRTELRDVFGKSLEAVRYVGTLGFQAGARGWVKPATAARSTGHQAVIA